MIVYHCQIFSTTPSPQEGKLCNNKISITTFPFVHLEILTQKSQITLLSTLNVNLYFGKTVIIENL